MELNEKQKQGLEIAIERYNNGQRCTVISGYAGSGKAQPNDTKIPTPDGFKKIGELRIGDYVFNKDGKAIRVSGVFPQGIIDNYKITFSDGRFTYCNEEHLWSYYTKTGNLITKTVKQMLESGLKYSGRGKYKFAVPALCSPIEYNEKEPVTIDPYVIGAFLGDGCCLEKQLKFSSNDKELVEEIQRLIGAKEIYKESEYNYTWKFKLHEKDQRVLHNGTKTIYYSTEELFKKYENEIMQYSYDKSIPRAYKYSSIENRYSLLQGLLDTDGTINETDGQRFNVRYTSTSKKLIYDVQEVLYSLGYKSSIGKDKRTEKYTHSCYTLSINIPNEEKYKLFRLSRKKDIAEKAKSFIKRKDYSRIAICNIEKQEEPVEMTCIMVDDPEHLYLTEGFVATHNTTLVKFIIAALPGIDPERDVVYTSFTGKATLVLAQKGNKNTSTLHKLLFKSFRKPDGGYSRKPVDVIDYKIVIVDEVSMVPNSLLVELAKHNAHVLFLGDPGQLPPIYKDEDNHLLDSPHIFLDEIMRQEEGSEIIDIATRVRQWKPLELFKGKDVQVLDKSDLNQGMYDWADQIIVATNETRKRINAEIRTMHGRGDKPEDGDKVICCRNYWDEVSDTEQALVNGTIGYLKNPYLSFRKISPRYLAERVGLPSFRVLESGFVGDDGSEFGNLLMDNKLILEGQKTLNWKQEYALNMNNNMRRNVPLEFEYGYAITCHRSQGSEWKKVLIIEEGFPFSQEEHSKWLYTAITRASEKVVIIRK